MQGTVVPTEARAGAQAGIVDAEGQALDVHIGRGGHGGRFCEGKRTAIFCADQQTAPLGKEQIHWLLPHAGEKAHH